MKSMELDTICPHCKYVMDHVSSTPFNPRAKPKVGDITMCIRCGEWAVFKEDLQLREPTDDEHIAFNKDARLMQARWAWNKMMEDLKGEKEMVTRVDRPIYAANDGTMFDSPEQAAIHDARWVFEDIISNDDINPPAVALSHHWVRVFNKLTEIHHQLVKALPHNRGVG